MINQMKIVILAIICLQISSMLTTSKAKIEAETSRAESQGVYYTLSDPVYYSYTPVYYTYTPNTFYYYTYTYDPYVTVTYPTTYTYTTYPSYWRKGGETSDNKEAKVEEMQKEVLNLKKEVYGKEDFSTDQIRKENKAYDSRWLIAQLKITRILELEDVIRQKSEGMKSRTTDDNVDAEMSFRHEELNDTKPAAPEKEKSDDTKTKLAKAKDETSAATPNAKVSVPKNDKKKTNDAQVEQTKPTPTQQKREEADSNDSNKLVDETTAPSKSSVDEKRPGAHSRPNKPRDPKSKRSDENEDCVDKECKKDKPKKEQKRIPTNATPASNSVIDESSKTKVAAVASALPQTNTADNKFL